MRVALIYPKLDYSLDFVGNQGYLQNMSGYPPLSLAYVAAIIRNSGHEAIIIDGNIENLKLKGLIERIKLFKSDLMGFSVTIPTFFSLSRWIKEIKKIYDLPVIIGGSQLGLYLPQYMLTKEIDYAFYGEVSASLPKFLSALQENNKSIFASIRGLCYRRDNEVVINEAPADSDFAELPFPARELLSNDKYFSPFSEQKNFTPFITSKGCFSRCAYCCLKERPQPRAIEGVIMEIKECFFRFKIRDIDFYDPVFTIDKKRTLEICRRLKEEKIPLRWSARTHINYIDEELLREMASCGCRMLMYGVESTSRKILEGLNRDFVDLDKIKSVIKLTRKYRIMAFGFFMLGAPDETESTMADTINFSKEAGFDFLQFTRIIAIPGTKLYSDYLREHKEDYWGKIVLGQEDMLKGGLLPVGTSLNSKIILRYARKGNIGFYLRPAQILKIILKIKSPFQFINFAKSGVNMLVSSLATLFFRSVR